MAFKQGICSLFNECMDLKEELIDNSLMGWPGQKLYEKLPKVVVYKIPKFI